MKKKKPKKSPAKSPSKSSPASSSKSAPPKSLPLESNPIELEDLDRPTLPSAAVSDAQIGSSADAAAQQSLGNLDLSPDQAENVVRETVIAVNSADPASTPVNAQSAIAMSSPNAPLVVVVSDNTNVMDMPSVSIQEANAVAKMGSLSSQDAKESTLPLGRENTTETNGSDAGSAQSVPVPVGPQETQTRSVRCVESTTPVATTGKSSVPDPPQSATADTWCAHAKGLGKRLSKKGEAFTLPSGEACIKIPNSVIEKSKKSWEPFVLGQFYSDPPSQGTLHNIVNGIWSKFHRDIVVSKMEGFAFLFRIPNAATRSRVINQRLWQIEGQTMFVDKWEPGVIPTKPELTSAPI